MLNKNEFIVFSTIVIILAMKGGQNKVTDIQRIKEHLHAPLTDKELIDTLSKLIQKGVVRYWTPQKTRFYGITSDAWKTMNAMFGEVKDQSSASSESVPA